MDFKSKINVKFALLIVLALGLIIISFLVSYLSSRPRQESNEGMASVSRDIGSLLPFKKDNVPAKEVSEVFGKISSPQIEKEGINYLPTGNATITNSIPKEDLRALPATAPVFKFSQASLLTRQVGEKMVANLRLNLTPELYPDGSLIWENETYRVALAKDNVSLWMERNMEVQFPAGPLNKEQAAIKVETFLRENGLLFPDLKIDKNRIEQVVVSERATGKEHPEEMVSSETVFGENFNALRVPIAYDLDVATGNAEGSNLREALVNSQNQVVRLKFFYRGLDLTQTGYYLLKPIEEVLGEINRSHLLVEDASVVTITASSIDAQSVQTVLYDWLNVGDYLQPVYLIKGEVDFKDSPKQAFSVVIPAIQ